MRRSQNSVQTSQDLSLSNSEISAKSNNDEQPEKVKSEILLNILVDACVSSNQVKRAIGLVQDIVQDQKLQNHEARSTIFSPDLVTFNTILKGCAQQKLFD